MKHLAIVLLSFFVLGCSSSDESTSPQVLPPTQATSMSLVSGINLRQNFDDPAYELGNPNTLTANKFVMYPNASSGLFYIMPQGTITAVYVVPATAEKIYQDINFSTLLHNALYTQQDIANNSVYGQTNFSSSTDIAVIISSFPKGYYKVFVKIDGQMYWDNLYKYNDADDPMEEMAALTAFWN